MSEEDGEEPPEDTHTPLTLALALVGTCFLVGVEPFVSYGSFVALAAVFVASLFLFASDPDNPKGVKLVRAAVVPSTLWVFTFSGVTFLDQWGGADYGVPFAAGICALMVIAYLLR